MSNQKNAVASPLMEVAFKLHDYIFNTLYPYPLSVKITNGKAAIKIDKTLQSKYIPCILLSVFIIAILVPGSCIFLLLVKLFQPNATNFGVVEVVRFIVIGSCTIYQIKAVILYYNSTEIETATNQIFFIEQNCKRLKT